MFFKSDEKLVGYQDQKYHEKRLKKKLAVTFLVSW